MNETITRIETELNEAYAQYRARGKMLKQSYLKAQNRIKEIDAELKRETDPDAYNALLREREEQHGTLAALENEMHSKKEPAISAAEWEAYKKELYAELAKLQEADAPAIEDAVIKAVELLQAYFDKAFAIEVLVDKASRLHNPAGGAFRQSRAELIADKATNSGNWMQAFVRAYIANMADRHGGKT